MNPSKNTFAFWAFVTPAIFAFILVVFIPLLIGVYYSFTSWDGIEKPIFVGMANYERIFSDKEFFSSLLFTAKFAIVSVITINVVGLSLAMLVTQKFLINNALRTVFFMPNLIGGLILGFIWQFIFLGVFPLMGLDSWLATPATGFWGLIILMTWQMSGYIMVIYIAYLQNVPIDVLEAAEVDGVSAWQKFRYIIFPLIAPGFTVSLFMTVSNSFKLFDQNLSLTGGGPYKSTIMTAMNIYNTAFAQKAMAYAQSKAVIFFLIIVAISLTQTYVNKKREVEM